MKTTRLCGAMALAAVLLALHGCGSPSNIAKPAAPTSTGTNDEHGHGEADEIAASLAKLSPEDAASAEKQRVCPVGEEPLGSMGAPVKVDVDGQPVWICCEGCKDMLLANPAEYLAKLKKD